MEPAQDKKNNKQKRIAVTQRLREFYSQLKAIVEVDSEDFYRRVMERAEHGGHAHRMSA